MIAQAIQLAKKMVPEPCRLLLRARRRGGHWFLRNEDRRVLEGEIIPYFAGRDDVAEILDVGRDWYTAGYPTLFAGKRYRSIDIDPDKTAHAINGEHQTVSLLELGQHFEAATFDLAIVNGVFGWGLNGSRDIADAMVQLHRALRPGGFVVVGWNDIDERRPDPLAEVLGAPGFDPFVLPPAGKASIETGTPYRHTFHFFKRAEPSLEGTRPRVP